MLMFLILFGFRVGEWFLYGFVGGEFVFFFVCVVGVVRDSGCLGGGWRELWSFWVGFVGGMGVFYVEVEV